jgi:hypothetical protein
MWLVLFCLAGLSATIVIKAATQLHRPVVAPAEDRRNLKREFSLNESAKSDRLELPIVHVNNEMVTLAQTAIPREVPPINNETAKTTARPHWRDANAKVIAANAPVHKKRKQPKRFAAQNPVNTRTAVWHCRQDAVGTLLRSLDLSPRCNL